MADKIREQQVYEQLKARHIGLGDSDTTKQEWMENVFKDSYHAALAHPGLLQYLSIANGVPKEQLRQEYIEKMAKPCNERP